MLASLNLDDQSFDEIMDYVRSRLPQLCPAWTDYNDSDPGITLLEMFAWYAEMQRYHINKVTSSVYRALLTLLGCPPGRERAAELMLELPDGCGALRAGARFSGKEDVVFELTQDYPNSADIAAVLQELPGGGVSELSAYISQPQISVAAFSREGEACDFLIGFSRAQGKTLSIYFEVTEHDGVPRNAFSADDQAPRTIEWSAGDDNILRPIEDETHALSRSGFVTLPVPESWPESVYAGIRGRFLRLRLTEPGCEGQARICAVSTRRVRAAQRETWARMQKAGERPALEDAVLYHFENNGPGLRQLLPESGGKVEFTPGREGFTLALDPLRHNDLVFDSGGLPNMELLLPHSEKQLLTHELKLVCETLCEDGVVRPAIWTYTDELSTALPNDRVFSLSRDRERIIFGDGENGAVVPKGKSAVIAAGYVVSWLENGNVPPGFAAPEDGGPAAAHGAAHGGESAETIRSASARLARRLRDERPCVSAADFERAALQTPGLRVAAAKAIPGYDFDDPAGVSRGSVISIVVLPDSGEPMPMPDESFIRRVREHLNSVRPVGLKIKVALPVYVPVSVRISIDMPVGKKDALERAVLDMIGRGAIGETLSKNAVLACAGAMAEAGSRVGVTLRSSSARGQQNACGDIEIPRNAIAYLAGLDIDSRGGGAP